MGISQLYNADGAINKQMNDDGVNTFSDTLTWNKEKHVIKVGGEFRRYWWYSGSVGAGAYGQFTFNGQVSGVGFAEFLLGVPRQANRLDPLTGRNSHDYQAGLFIGDTFKVTPKLTIDYGVRWDLYGIATYDDGLAYNFDLSDGKVVVPAAARDKVNKLFPANIPIKTGQVIPNADKKNIHPRISAAYRLTPKTVLRGGYSEYADSWSYTARRSGNTPYQMTESYYQVISSSGPLFAFPNPFPDASKATVASQSVTVYPVDTKTGTVRQINFTLEREIYNMGVRLSYVGMRNTGLAYGTYNMNKPQPSTAAFDQSMRPYNLYNSVNVYGDDGETHYNSLQMEVQKRMGSFVFNSNFTWSKNMYNYANTENPYDITNHWARDASNREKYWVTSFTWQLPFGRQRRFLASAPAIVDHALGGWTVNFVNTMASPTYLSPSFSGSDPSGTNTSGGLPDAIAAPTSGITRTIDHWFNEKSFAIPTKGYFGNASPNSVEGYGINVQHLSLAKTFTITERLRTSFTGSFSNLMNHPHFSGINMGINSANPGKFTGTRPQYEPEKQGYRQMDLKMRFEF
jgi:hypothetical protein